MKSSENLSETRTLLFDDATSITFFFIDNNSIDVMVGDCVMPFDEMIAGRIVIAG